MNYRTPAIREPSPPRQEVVDLPRFSRLYVRSFGAFAIACALVALVTFGSTDIVCDRSAKGAAATCELVESRLAFPSHDRIQTLEVMEANTNDDGPKPQLMIDTVHQPAQFFDLRERNEQIATAFRQFKASSEPHLSLRINRDLFISGTSLLIAFTLGIPLVLISRSRRRLLVDLDTGMVTVQARAETTAEYGTKGFRGVSTESAGGDSDLDHVVLEVGKERHVLGQASSGIASSVASRLNALLHEIHSRPES